MNTPPPRQPPLLSAAAIVSLLVLALSAVGLFGLSYTNTRTAATLDRLADLYAAEIEAEQARADFKTQVQEWKNLLLRGSDPASFDRYLAQFEARAMDVQESLRKIGEHLDGLGESNDDVMALIVDHRSLRKTYADALRNFDQAHSASAFAVDTAVRGVDRPLAEGIEALASRVRGIALGEHAELHEAATERYAGLRRITLVAAGLTIASSFLLVFLANRVGRS